MRGERHSLDIKSSKTERIVFKDGFNVLISKLLSLTSEDIDKAKFLEETLYFLLNFSKASTITLSLYDDGAWVNYEPKINDKGFPFLLRCGEVDLNALSEQDILLLKDAIKFIKWGILHSKKSFETTINFGAFYTGHIKEWLNQQLYGTRYIDLTNTDYNSVLIIPLRSNDQIVGFLILQSKLENYFTKSDIINYEEFSLLFIFIILHKKTNFNLNERVKELNCLYGVSKILSRSSLTLSQIFIAITEILPRALQFSDIAFCTICFDGIEYSNQKTNILNPNLVIEATIFCRESIKGKLIIGYKKYIKEFDSRVIFLPEERALVDTISKQLSLAIERKVLEEERKKLSEQLLHADRLATIGQLAAGIAHEINEPLNAILGYAELIKNEAGVEKQISSDCAEIIKSTLYAREIIKKLLFFSRQMVPNRSKIELNSTVKEGMFFIKSRLSKDNIELIYELSNDLPEIVADKAQIHQVLLNLVVNAIQAMKNGGILTIGTRRDGNYLVFYVKDTGIGMPPEIRKDIFLPFFTTKGVNEGTGLGLSVVHGIVTAHNGKINVESKVGKGSTFEVFLPLS